MKQESIHSYELASSVTNPTKLVTFGIIAFIVGLDASMAQIAIYRISDYFDVSHTQALWIIDIYGVSLGGSLLICGRLCDKIGPRLVLVVGIGAFACASFASAFATDWRVLVAARVLAGISAAAVTTSSLGSFRKHFGAKQHVATGVASWMVGVSLGTALAPAAGGMLLMTSVWQTIFVLPGICILVLGLGCWKIFPTDRKPTTKLNIWKPLVITAGIVASFVIVKGATGIGFRVALTLVAIILISGYLITVEAKKYLARTSKEGTHQITCLIALFLSMAAISGVWYVSIKYLQFGLGLTASYTGLLMVVPAACQVATSMIFTAHRVYQFRAGAIAIGGAFATGILLATSFGHPPTLVGIILVCAAVNAGLTPLAIYAAESVLTASKVEQAGTFAAASESSAETGFAFGIAILGTIANIHEGELQVSKFRFPVSCQWYSVSKEVGARHDACELLYHSVMSEVMLIASVLIATSCCFAFRAMRR